MEEYKSNSNRAKEKEPERKKVEKVVTGCVKTKKKSSSQKLAEVFISEDITSVKSYIFSDVLVPSLKDTLYDAVTSGLSMLLGGDGRSSRSSRISTNSRESYSKYYKQNTGTNRSASTSYSKSDRYSYDDVILETRGEAEEVLDVLTGLVEEYGMASLADLYEAVGKPTNYTDNKYGWYDLRSASVSRTRDGYLVKLPRVSLLD